MSRRFWTANEVAALRQMASTHTLQTVAAQLSRSRASVSGKAVALGISCLKCGEANHASKLTTAQLDELFALRAQGWLHKSLALKFGLSETGIWRILNFESRYRETLPHVLASLSRREQG